MITSSIYGRLGRDPKAMTTKTGKAMCTASIAVDVGREQGDGETLWITVMGFGQLAEALQRHQQGDMIAATGRLTRSRYTGTDGQERESWSLIADALHSSRTVRPGQRRQASRNGKNSTRSPDRAGHGDPAGADFDDPLTFW
jgi:single-strand DNA-binding protein